MEGEGNISYILLRNGKQKMINNIIYKEDWRTQMFSLATFYIFWHFFTENLKN